MLMHCNLLTKNCFLNQLLILATLPYSIEQIIAHARIIRVPHHETPKLYEISVLYAWWVVGAADARRNFSVGGNKNSGRPTQLLRERKF